MTDQPLPVGSKVLIYTRVSPRDGTEDGELSVESQVVELQAAAARWGWRVLQVYTDQLLSGASDDRPAFQEMVARALRGGDVDGILVWRFSRFARDDVDSMLYKAQLAKAGVRVLSYKEPIPDAGGWGPLIERIIEIMDARELQQIREDTKRGQRRLASQGYSAGGRPPVGYLAQRVRTGTRPDGQPRYNTVWVPDEARAPDVRAAFQDLMAGSSYHEIHERYHLTRSGNGLHDLFRNPAYVGWRAYDRRARQSGGRRRPRSEWTVKENAHEAIVPRELWERVQDLLDSRRKGPRPSGRARGRGSYLLTGLLVCGLCGDSVVGSSQTNRARGRRYRYYRCSRKDRQGWHVCELPSFRAEVLETAILDAIAANILTPDRILELTDQVNAELASAGGEPHDHRDALRRQLQALEGRIRNLVEAIEVHGVQSAGVVERLAELEARKMRVATDLDALDQRLSAWRPLNVTPAQVAALVEDLAGTLASAPMPERRALLRSFVQEIRVHPDRGEIRYHPPLPLVVRSSDQGRKRSLEIGPRHHNPKFTSHTICSGSSSTDCYSNHNPGRVTGAVSFCPTKIPLQRRNGIAILGEG